MTPYEAVKIASRGDICYMTRNMMIQGRGFVQSAAAPCRTLNKVGGGAAPCLRRRLVFGGSGLQPRLVGCGREVCSAKAHSRAIGSGERGRGFRAGLWWKARGAFVPATEGRCSGCALRHRPPCLRCRRMSGIVWRTPLPARGDRASRTILGTLDHFRHFRHLDSLEAPEARCCVDQSAGRGGDGGGRK
jgi:hypothetical protein